MTKIYDQNTNFGLKTEKQSNSPNANYPTISNWNLGSQGTPKQNSVLNRHWAPSGIQARKLLGYNVLPYLQWHFLLYYQQNVCGTINSVEWNAN